MHFWGCFFLLAVVSAKHNKYIDYMENRVKNITSKENEVLPDISTDSKENGLTILKTDTTDKLSKDLQKIVKEDKQSKQWFNILPNMYIKNYNLF